MSTTEMYSIIIGHELQGGMFLWENSSRLGECLNYINIVDDLIPDYEFPIVS